MSFDDDLEAQLNAEADWADCDITVNNKLVRLRFTQLDALEWADLCDLCPPRPGSPIDRNFGYNFRAVVTLAAPKSGKRLDGEEAVELTADQWRKLLKSINPLSLRTIGDVIFNLNEWIPAQEVAAAKKAFAVESDKSSSSPADSASPALDS